MADTEASAIPTHCRVGELVGLSTNQLTTQPTNSPPPRYQLPHRARRLVRHDVQQPVRPLPNVPHPLVAVREQVLLTDDARAVEHEAHEPARGHPADEHAPAPRGE